jgi:hypothetical protein
MRAGLDVYLFPAVVGGGWGDIEEVLLAGRDLARRGHRILLYRGAGRALPRSVEGPFEWPAHTRSTRLRPRAPRALTLSAWWGVAAAPPRDEPFGRAGPWAEESAAIERAYGPDDVVHVSFEEFARTLTSRQQTVERWREGGVPLREIRRKLRAPTVRAEVAAFHEAYAKFRGFDRPNVLHLYPSFEPSRAFAREFPAAVQCGPFWPERAARSIRRDPNRWIWYASPGSSARLADRIAQGVPSTRPPMTLDVRSPVALALPTTDRFRWRTLPPLPAGPWRARYAGADLRIATGSRTLLEALEAGGPFLYFNGVSGPAGAERRHRPEKIEALLRVWRKLGVDPQLRRDLADFSRLRNVASVLGRARTSAAWRRSFPRRRTVRGFRPPYDSAAELVARVADEFAHGKVRANALVARVRRG